MSNPIAIGGGTTATGDLANAAVPNPDLSITKTDGVSTVYRGGSVAYTIVVTNSSAYPVHRDRDRHGACERYGRDSGRAPPPQVRPAQRLPAAAMPSTRSATLLVGGTATYTVSGTVSRGGERHAHETRANVAVPAFLTDSNPANNTASDSDTINLNANLGIMKTDGLSPTSTRAAPSRHTIVVSNAGPDASNGSIVTDTVPATITARQLDVRRGYRRR